MYLSTHSHLYFQFCPFLDVASNSNDNLYKVGNFDDYDSSQMLLPKRENRFASRKNNKCLADDLFAADDISYLIPALA